MSPTRYNIQNWPLVVAQIVAKFVAILLLNSCPIVAKLLPNCRQIVEKFVEKFVAKIVAPIFIQVTLIKSFIHRHSRDRRYDHNFRRFCQFSAKKVGVFLKNQCYDPFCAKTSILFSKKTPIFSPNFSAKIFFKS
jgi:hypothetical protein